MDLNARPQRSIWDLFRCCHNDGSEEQHECPSTTTKPSSTNKYAFLPVKLLGTKAIGVSSAAAAETTLSTADFSFETQDSNFDAPFDADISMVAKEGEEPEEQTCDSKNGTGFKEQVASLFFKKVTKAVCSEEEDDGLIGINYVGLDGEEDSSLKASPAKKQGKNTGLIQFYRFFIFMILRHLFGAAMLRGFIERNSLKNFFLLKNASNEDETQNMNFLGRLKLLNEKKQ